VGKMMTDGHLFVHSLHGTYTS